MSPLGHREVSNRPQRVIGWAGSGRRTRPSFAVGVTAEVTQQSAIPAPRPDFTARPGRALAYIPQQGWLITAPPIRARL
jgi:hypothetical protein